MPVKLLIAIPVMATVGAGIALYQHRETVLHLIESGRLHLARLLYTLADGVHPENRHDSEFAETHSLMSMRGRSPSPSRSRRNSGGPDQASASGIDSSFHNPSLRHRSEPATSSTPIDIHPRHPPPPNPPTAETPPTIRPSRSEEPLESGYDTAHDSIHSTPTLHAVDFHNPAFDHINPLPSTGTSYATAIGPTTFGSRDRVVMPQPSFESAAYWSVNEWDDGTSGASTPSLAGSDGRPTRPGVRTPGSESGSEIRFEELEGFEGVETRSVRSEGTDGWSEMGSEVSSEGGRH
ncbi:hypothetical protein BJ508DRAFT_322153 [Ascobolus immersus RN42]|uniref:Uncharacterized protein n=1 Tax=Ascobolus immersus RN42 TaxID=1160509 RepID=A0A3N4IIN7_ASCIM|nr:hypothetical protein BJ508DRAFT_322153 [Ascobolus immersus RN42]